MRRGLVEADEKCIVDCRHIGEALDVLRGLVGDIDRRERATGGLGECGGNGRADEVEVFVGREGHGWAVAAARRGNHGAGRNEDVVVLRNGEGELHSRVCGGRRSKRLAEEVEELDPVQLGNLVQPEDQLVDHVGEGFDQRDARVGHVVVGPLGSTLLKEAFRLVDEVLKGAVVQIGGWKAHYPSCSGIR